MYIDNQIKFIRVTWGPIVVHTYDRVSRAKWRIKLNYACGAEMFLENQPDDLIQCLILGAFNSGKAMQIGERQFPAEESRPMPPIGGWAELQEVILG